MKTCRQTLLARLQPLNRKRQSTTNHCCASRAETENMRRRAAEDVLKAGKFGAEKFANAMLPVKDSLEAALLRNRRTRRAAFGRRTDAAAVAAGFQQRQCRRNESAGREIRSAQTSGHQSDRSAGRAEPRGSGAAEGLPAARARAAPGTCHRFEGGWLKDPLKNGRIRPTSTPGGHFAHTHIYRGPRTWEKSSVSIWAPPTAAFR
jgi:hypothetical protein